MAATREATTVSSFPKEDAPRFAAAGHIEIDLEAIRHNARAIKSHVGARVGVLAMLKADAYGHGLTRVAQALELEESNGNAISGFVVTSARDGLALRHANIALPTFVMSPTWSGYDDVNVAVLRADLTPVLTSIADLEAFARAAKAIGVIGAPVHVKLDTGLGRLGVREDELASFLSVAAKLRDRISITGLCTHLSSADEENRTATWVQLDAFDRGLARVRGAGHEPTTLHVANSAATYRHPRSHFTHVRTGIALFGGDESSSSSSSSPSTNGGDLRPALRLTTKIAQVRAVERGETVSYGARWCAERPSSVAILPIGYGHGYPRSLSGRAEVSIHGRRCPVIGMICMEMTLVDVTDLADDDEARPGDEVTLIGGEMIRPIDLARMSGCIVEEIFCGLSKELSRTYVSPRGGSTSNVVWLKDLR